MTTNGTSNPQPPPFRIAIMGAGIAGLSAALSLRHFFCPPSSSSPPTTRQQSPLQMTIYEKASQLREIGASIALNPSGLRILDKLGVDEALAPEGGIAYRQPSGSPMVYLHWRTGEVIGRDAYKGDDVDLERHATARFHRAHLQGALLRALGGNGNGGDGSGVEIKLGVRAEKFEVLGSDGGGGGETREGEGRVEAAGGGVRISFEDGSTTEADLLIGADGIHSKVRQTFAPEHQLQWTGQVALRATFDASLVRNIPDVPRDAVHIVGHETTLFASYLGKNQYTIVGNYFCDPDDASAPYHDAKWNGRGDVAFLQDLYKEWSPLVRALTATAPFINTYPNYAGTPLPTLAFASGRVVLLGDAAHTHGGAFAAGGSLAINDAYCLAMALSHVWRTSSSSREQESKVIIANAAELYDETRRPLVTRVLDTVHANYKKAKRGGWGETEEELRARVARRPDLSWLTEHDVEAEFQTVVDRLGY